MKILIDSGVRWIPSSTNFCASGAKLSICATLVSWAESSSTSLSCSLHTFSNWSLYHCYTGLMMGCTMTKAVPGNLSAVALTDASTSPMTALIMSRTFSASMSVEIQAMSTKALSLFSYKHSLVPWRLLFGDFLRLTFVVIFVNYFCLQNLNFLNFGKKFIRLFLSKYV